VPLFGYMYYYIMDEQKQYRALVLDDDELIRNLMVDALSADEDTRWFVTVVTSAEEAWARITSGQRFDVASVDIRLGGRSGLDLIEDMLRDHIPVPVVVISGTVDAHTVLKCLEMGASDYVLKPFEIRSYRNAMKRAAEMFLESGEAWMPLELAAPVTDWVEITSPTMTDFLFRFRQFSKTLLRNLRSPNLVEDLRLALEEMIHNAIEWGNRYQVSKQVRVAYCIFTDRIVVKVEDEGEGFVPENIEDPTRDPLEHSTRRREMGKRPGGYGIHLVKAVMDEVMYNRKGNVVLFTKYIL
jgi:CheY-like chemotaxis protein